MSDCAFSFVIPVLNEAEHLAEMLDDLLKRYPQAEVLVVDGGSSDASLEVASGKGITVITSELGRASQMNAGAQLAVSPYIFFLHADTRPGISEDELISVLAQKPDWGFFKVRLNSSRAAFRIIEWATNLRSSLTSVATGDQLIFVRRDLWLQHGPYADLPLMEDVQWCKRYRKLSRPTVLAAPVETSARRWETNGVVRTVLTMWALRLAYFLGVSPRRLWGIYYGAR